MKLALVVAMVAGMVGCSTEQHELRVEIFNTSGDNIALFCLADSAVAFDVDMTNFHDVSRIVITPHSSGCVTWK